MKILLATDGTKHSKPALEMVTNFVLGEGDEVRIISVIDVSIPMTFDAYTGYIPDTTEIEKAARENADNALEETKKILHSRFQEEGVSVETEILIGAPEIAIVEKAEEMGADVIVVGSHGYNRWERLLLGSVSDSVVHHAPCSVLVVRGAK